MFFMTIILNFQSKNTVRNLILTVLSLNVLPQLLRPILEEVMPLPPEEVQKLIARRKEENVKLIINSLRP